MKMKSYKWTVVLMVAAVGAYHVAEFGKHSHLPPVAKTEVIWGELHDRVPSSRQTPQLDPSLCTEAPEVMNRENQGGSTAVTTTRIRFEYRPVASEFVHNGNSVQVLMAQGSSMTIGKVTYPLQQIALTRTDEEGQLGITLVHRLENGRTAVVTVPLQISSKRNLAFDTVLRYLPKHQGDSNSLDDVHIDINNLLPRDRSYYRYPSQTSCNDKVVVLGLDSPVKISAAQVEKITQVLQQQYATTVF